MTRIQHSRKVAFGIAVVLAGALISPMAGGAEEPTLAVAPGLPTWDQTSGYGPVEASRAAAASLLVSDASWDATSGYGAVERSRASASAMHTPSSTASMPFRGASCSPDGELVDDLTRSQIAAEQTAARAWDQMSGYGSVEASRAASTVLAAENPR